MVAVAVLLELVARGVAVEKVAVGGGKIDTATHT